MNGRCQKDALDRADDICELCGHQYCAHCLLFPRGHRNPPTCKTCALENSGLRGGSTKHHPISRREYKKRKKELLTQLENSEEQRPPIEYFDLQDPSEFDRSNELDRRPVLIEEEAPIDILAPEVAQPATPGPAIPPPPAPAPPPPSPPPANASGPEEVDRALAGLAPVDTSINPLAVGGPPAAPMQPTPPDPRPSEASASAADLLARLKADQPIQSQFTAAPMGLDTDPFASTSDLIGGVPEIEQPSATSAPVAAAAPTTIAKASTSDAQPRSGAWTPPSPPPRGSNIEPMDDGFTDRTTTDRHTTDRHTTGSNSTSVAGDATTHDASAEEGVMVDRRKADVDASGQWIPPSLRGMASPEVRDPLPKRH